MKQFKLLIIWFLVFFSLSAPAFSDKSVTFDQYFPVFINSRAVELNYGSLGEPDLKLTEIITVKIKVKEQNGVPSYFYKKKWDIRVNNPDGLPQLPSACKTANRVDCDKWLYLNTATEAINVNYSPSFE